MSKLFSKFLGVFRYRNLVGVDKAGNRYFTRTEKLDGVVKEKRWVIFKGEEDPTSIPVEWICWLNGQRKKAPTPQEMIELEARRERVKLNAALLKKEEEMKSTSSRPKPQSIGKVESPDLESFIQQFRRGSIDHNKGMAHDDVADIVDGNKDDKDKERSSEPTGSGESFKPGTWQPPM
ncbi:NADH dehydrogenase [ubiquinone] 1 alpha subcomplex assembly factor 2-like [Dioscorea cayenensis subsp. rotundata]|uniref:NADH dehydrogenase [ubiquinone] 1 alpha subcomplex subunit 12 n=1 Tax=Dioscorea cayennensis subsp. rotundata TaxID=55577 RepID=A0AB40B0B8_DIOCR|nr:NADH dehydrogenase [ubiquinone] 1 alpha subcomplex assembly factor 2-like [Dioscorea cayenensis subsp. rotundata]